MEQPSSTTQQAFVVKVISQASPSQASRMKELVYDFYRIEVLRSKVKKVEVSQDAVVLQAENVSQTILDEMLKIFHLPHLQYREYLRNVLIDLMIAQNEFDTDGPYHELQLEYINSQENTSYLKSDQDALLPYPYEAESEDSYLARVEKLARRIYKNEKRVQRPKRIETRATSWLLENLGGVKYEDIANRANVSVSTVKHDIRNLRAVVGMRRKKGRPRKG